MIRDVLKKEDIGGLFGSYVIKTWKAGTKELLWQSNPIKNKIVSSAGYGRNMILRQLGGTNFSPALTLYPLEIDNAKIGTGTTAPVDADTDLETTVLGTIAIALAEISVNDLIISLFIPDADLANGTYTELGLFCNGRLFARSIISPSYTKGSNQDTTIEWTITFTG